MNDEPHKDVTQTPEYLGGYLDAIKNRERQDAAEAQARAEKEAGVVRTPNGVFRPSDDSGVMITVTQPHDPAYFLLQDGHTTSTTVYHRGCYICEDPEFAQMGLPLCRECPECRKAGRQAPEPDHGFGHVPADDCACSVCGFDEYEAHCAELEEKQREERADDPAP